jgi:hypothetical protein
MNQENQLIEYNDAQACWDRLLLSRFLDNFYTPGFAHYMSSLMNIYRDITGIYPATLKRVPKNEHQRRMRPARFVCAYLPRLASILIDKEETKEDIPDLVEKLRRWNIDTVMIEQQLMRESRELAYSKLKYNGAMLERVLVADFHDTSLSAGRPGRENRAKATRGHKK